MLMFSYKIKDWHFYFSCVESHIGNKHSNRDVLYKSHISLIGFILSEFKMLHLNNVKNTMVVNIKLAIVSW